MNQAFANSKIRRILVAGMFVLGIPLTALAKQISTTTGADEKLLFIPMSKVYDPVRCEKPIPQALVTVTIVNRLLGYLLQPSISQPIRFLSED